MNARERAIEVMARADFEAVSRVSDPPFPRWDELSEYDRNEWRTQAGAILDALLAAVSSEPCPTCGGEMTVLALNASGKPATRNGTRLVCPDCTDGTRPGSPLLVALLVEAGVMWPVVLSGGNYPDEGGPTVYCARALLPTETEPNR